MPTLRAWSEDDHDSVTRIHTRASLAVGVVRAEEPDATEGAGTDDERSPSSATTPSALVAPRRNTAPAAFVTPRRTLEDAPVWMPRSGRQPTGRPSAQSVIAQQRPAAALPRENEQTVVLSADESRSLVGLAIDASEPPTAGTTVTIMVPPAGRLKKIAIVAGAPILGALFGFAALDLAHLRGSPNASAAAAAFSMQGGTVESSSEGSPGGGTIETTPTGYRELDLRKSLRHPTEEPRLSDERRQRRSVSSVPPRARAVAAASKAASDDEVAQAKAVLEKSSAERSVGSP